MASEAKSEVAVSTKPRSEIVETRPTPMFGPLEEVERLFDRLMPRAWIRPMAWNWPMWSALEHSMESVRVPQLDIVDRDKDILIRVELPGVDKKDIDVSVTDSALNIKGCVRHETKEEKSDYFRCEISQGNFSRSIALPSGIDTSKISATLKDGVLEIALLKEEGVQRRSVEVK